MSRTSNILRGFEKAAAVKIFPAFKKAVNITGLGPKATQKDIEKAYRGFRSEAMRQGGGPDSLVMWLPMKASEKMFGKKRTRKRMWKAISEPGMRADMALGNVLSKTPLVGKSLFKTKQHIPWGKGMKREVEVNSALAPLKKARTVAVPLVLGTATDKALDKTMGGSKKKESRGMNKQAFQEKLADPSFREKIASTMIRLHEENKDHVKRAHATRLIYKAAEMGAGETPRTHEEFEEKLASLMKEDLAVYEKALELRGGGELFTGLAEPAGDQSLNAMDKFANAMAEMYHV